MFAAFLELKAEVENLKKENALLKARIAELEKPKKDSSNSSIAPSKDENRKPKRNQSLRVKSGKRVGGQKGHKGNYLKMVEKPDKIVKQKPTDCKSCGQNLSQAQSKVVEKRQVIDIELPKKQVVEYQNHQVICPKCSYKNIGNFPQNIPRRVSYGKTVEALIGYFQVRHFLPYKRTTEVFSDLFDLKISCGTVKNRLKKLYEKGWTVYKNIKNAILKSSCIGSDETGFKINADKFWAWVWQNDFWTYISINQSRGYKAIEDEFCENDLLQLILVCDRYPAQLKSKTKSKQFCLAHLLRDLMYLCQLYKQSWSKKLTAIILAIYDFKRKCENYKSKECKKVVDNIELRIEKLLKEKIAIKYPMLRTLREKLKKNKEFLTTCLHYKNVPPDNNWSERAIRNFKTKMKISGGFRSIDGARIYATLRSITDTAIKQNQNVWQTFLNLAQNKNLKFELAE